MSQSLASPFAIPSPSEASSREPSIPPRTSGASHESQRTPTSESQTEAEAKPETNSEFKSEIEPEAETKIESEIEAASHTDDETNLPVLDIIRQLSRGTLRAEQLSVEMRQQCVAHMTDEGFSSPEIGDVLHISGRTVRRDRAAIRKANAIQPNIRLGDEWLGEMQRLTHNAIQRLTRLANQPDANQYTKLWSNEAITRMYERMMKMANAMEFTQGGRGRLRKQNEKEASFNPYEGPVQPGELDVLRRLMMVK